MKDCVSCVHEYLSPMSDTCRECGIAMLNYEEAKPKPCTNYDSIRAKSVEEMAEFIAKVQRAGSYGRAGAVFDYINLTPDMVTLWLDWLKQEVAE